jgi:hypothetical protein
MKNLLFGLSVLFLIFTSCKAKEESQTPIIPPDGTFEHPYLINSKTELMLMRDSINLSRGKYANKVYKLMTDIDLTNEPSWEPIEGFKGIFSGNGKIIKNVTIASSGNGFFAKIDGGTVVNLGIIWNSINTTSGCTGGITGYLSGGAIINCFTSCSFFCGQACGGITGQLSINGTISNCYSFGSMTSYCITNPSVCAGICASMMQGSGGAGKINNCISLAKSLTAIGNGTGYPFRITAYTSEATIINNYASPSMTLKKGLNANHLSNVTDFTDIKQHGIYLTGNPVDLLNAYVTTNPSYNGIALSKWKLETGVNSGNPIFQ